PEKTIRERWQDVNRLLRLSMMSGQQMQLDATLNHLCEEARQLVSFDRALGYFWNEKEERFNLRSCLGLSDELRARQGSGNLFNLWAAKHGKPMLFPTGRTITVDALLADIQCRAAVVVPIFVNNRVM